MLSLPAVILIWHITESLLCKRLVRVEHVTWPHCSSSFTSHLGTMARQPQSIYQQIPGVSLAPLELRWPTAYTSSCCEQLIIQTYSPSSISNPSPCHTTRPSFRTSTSTLSTLPSPLSPCNPLLCFSHLLKTPRAVTLQRHNGINWLELSKPEAILPFSTQLTSASYPAAPTLMPTAFAYLLTQRYQCC